MGILNINSDSFVSQSRCDSLEESIKKAEQMIKDGVDIIDIGAESTRPGSTYVEEDEECSRVIPVIKEVVTYGVPVSIDTYKPGVAQQALDHGVVMINDVSGGTNPEMLRIVKAYHAQIVLMHNNSNNQLPHAQPVKKEHKDIVYKVVQELQEQTDRALSYGISKESIIVDPGLGFQKHWKDSVQLMRNVYKIKELGYAVLVGASRKGFIGSVLSQKNAEDRLEGTLACTAISITQGADIVRVHDVKPNADVAKFTDFVYR